MIRFLFCIGFLLSGVSGISQTAHAKPETAPLDPLSFMLGKWEGQSWTMGPQGKSYAIATEHVYCKWDCELFLVEGKGSLFDSTTQTSKILHNAFGIIRYDHQYQTFIMQAYSQGKGMIESEVKVINQYMVQWGMDIPGGGKMRYTADFREAGKWKERGEYSRDGETWHQVVGMELTKIE